MSGTVYYQFWLHAPTEDVYAVRLDDQDVTGICGPLDEAERLPDLLPDFPYDDDDGSGLPEGGPFIVASGWEDSRP